MVFCVASLVWDTASYWATRWLTSGPDSIHLRSADGLSVTVIFDHSIGLLVSLVNGHGSVVAAWLVNHKRPVVELLCQSWMFFCQGKHVFQMDRKPPCDVHIFVCKHVGEELRQYSSKLASQNALMSRRMTSSIDSTRSQSSNCGLSSLGTVIKAEHPLDVLSSLWAVISVGRLQELVQTACCYLVRLTCSGDTSNDSAVPDEATPASNRALAHPLSRRKGPIDLSAASSICKPPNTMGWSAAMTGTWPRFRNATVSLILTITCLIVATEWAWSHRRGSRDVMLTSNVALSFFGCVGTWPRKLFTGLNSTGMKVTWLRTLAYTRP